jgi:hypothetical protein
MEWIHIDIAGITAACCLGQILVLPKSRPSQAREAICGIAWGNKVKDCKEFNMELRLISKKTMKILLMCARDEYEYVDRTQQGGNGP